MYYWQFERSELGRVIQIFRCQTPSDALADRKCTFLKKFIVSDNMICQVFKDVAMGELALLPSKAY